MGKLAFDSETGEILGVISDFRTPEDLERHRRIQEIKKYKLRGNRPFVCCHHDPIKQVTPHLSLTESGAIMKLLLYMKMNSEGLLQKDGKPLKQLDIPKILGKGIRQTADIVKRLETLSILLSVKDGRSKLLYINEDFHVMGKGVGKKYFTKLLTTKLREVVEELKLEQLGFLYKILPYFHYDTCILAHNPNEQDKNKIRYMNRKELAYVINYDVDNVTTLVKELSKKGLIMKTEASGNALYWVHPDLMYRQANDGNTAYSNTLREMFEAHQKESTRNSRKGD